MKIQKKESHFRDPGNIFYQITFFQVKNINPDTSNCKKLSVTLVN